MKSNGTDEQARKIYEAACAKAAKVCDAGCLIAWIIRAAKQDADDKIFDAACSSCERVRAAAHAEARKVFDDTWATAAKRKTKKRARIYRARRWEGEDA